MAAAKEVQFSLKVMMIKESNKVLYAEIDSDFADVLLSFLTLPLGTIVRLLIKHYADSAPILGSLNSLYAGLQNVDNNYFWTEAGKLMLLNPRNSSENECSKLKVRIDVTPPIHYFLCKNRTCVSMHYGMKCLCKDPTNTVTGTNLEIESQSEDKSVFAAKTSSFLLIDDLEILINTPASLFRVLKLYGIKETDVIEERTLIVGLKEIMELLKGSLVSKTPITDMVLGISSAAATFNERKNFSASGKFEPDALPESKTRKDTRSDSKRITVKVFVQKSTNRFLLVQAWQDFDDFLFSLLTIPLGRVQFFLGSNTCLGSINNFYRSISDLEILAYMKSEETSTRLLEPQLPPYYLSDHQIFSLTQQSSPTTYRLYRQKLQNGYVRVKLCDPGFGYTQMKMIDPKGKAQSHKSVFTAQTATFLLTDDLQLLINSSASFFRILKLNGIEDTSVLEERTLTFGLKEIMELLKRSLVSKTPITDVVVSIGSAAATLNNRKIFFSAKYEPDALPQAQIGRNRSSDSKKIAVKILVQKSTNRVLLAQTWQDFIDFLFSLLTIPLGRIQILLVSNTFLGSIHNLYRSISDLEKVKYIKSREAVTKLLEPQIPPFYLSKYQIFSLNEQSSPALYRRYDDNSFKLFNASSKAAEDRRYDDNGFELLVTSSKRAEAAMKMIDPKGQGSFVKGPKMFAVTDDLTVSTPPSTSIFSTLDKMKIPPSDVEEQELVIGMEEALSILKASLTSTCALSEGLKPFLKRQPKQEK